MSNRKPNFSYASLSKQYGLSIVELMIALVLSLVVMFATTSIYVSNKQTYRFLDQYSMLQENGRFAIFFLREHISQAGFPRQANVDPFPTVPANNKTVIVQFRSAVDCLGDVVTAVAPAVPTTTSTFTVNANQELTCNNTPLVEGIESMRILYGEDFSADGIASTYVTRDNVTDWANVVSVRVALLAQGQPESLDEAQNITYNLLGTPIVRNDKTPRRVFTTTIPLRNRNKTII
jgi:type IV pilus assembly protein PilW